MPARARWGRLPLTQRLTLFFTVVAAAVVLGLGVMFLIATGQHFVALDRIALQDKQHLIEEILRNAHSAENAGWRLGEALSYHHGLYARVTDAQGELVFQSQGFAPDTQSAPAGPAMGTELFGTWEHGGSIYHTLRFEAAPAYSQTALRVLIATDTDHHAQFLRDLRRDLALYVAAAIVVCGLLSWLAARQGLAPLREMRSRAAAVTSQKLTERMPVQVVPVEMADLAQELNRMLDRLQEDFQRLTDFSSDLAHELRTPISNLLTQTQVALTTKRDAATYRDILASNAEEFERLARMVADMLFLAKTERGVDLPHKERFSARQDSLALLEFYEAVAEEKRIRFRLEGDGDIEGDRLMFRRALSNLLSNALRHTPEAGTITVCIAGTAQSTVVSVENTGPDIDPKMLPRLFDRFYRADPTRAHPDAEGSGLGLAITRAIVQAHGGHVTVTSSHGHTCFALVFPHRATQA
ncbi:heavy metal sensor histidine kinase [Comamonas sp. NLF-1-9]|uniref:heavy metal sensor histidine kinase n=1 Tax=Comamonas sp. NLF-1-9 TaxID=2853163 RepID=UPI001C46D6F5|nr:heavy metal sensor histidine kinase [Comamonas sp. NLF-1-9]QXL85129.1 heavy metal sensor histidine kinase [Comamonas sp. NLF-1-9]